MIGSDGGKVKGGGMSFPGDFGMGRDKGETDAQGFSAADRAEIARRMLAFERTGETQSVAVEPGSLLRMIGEVDLCLETGQARHRSA